MAAAAWTSRTLPGAWSARYIPRVEIMVNGEPRVVSNGATVSVLLAELALSPTSVAVEVNLEIVPRASYAQTALPEGASVEIVTFVGGG